MRKFRASLSRAIVPKALLFELLCKTTPDRVSESIDAVTTALSSYDPGNVAEVANMAHQ